MGDAIRDYLKENDFTEFHSPKLLAEATEGGAEVFKVDYLVDPEITLDRRKTVERRAKGG